MIPSTARIFENTYGRPPLLPVEPSRVSADWCEDDDYVRISDGKDILVCPAGVLSASPAAPLF